MLAPAATAINAAAVSRLLPVAIPAASGAMKTAAAALLMALDRAEETKTSSSTSQKGGRPAAKPPKKDDSRSRAPVCSRILPIPSMDPRKKTIFKSTLLYASGSFSTRDRSRIRAAPPKPRAG